MGVERTLWPDLLSASGSPAEQGFYAYDALAAGTLRPERPLNGRPSSLVTFS